MNLNEFLKKEEELKQTVSEQGKEFLKELFQPLFDTGLIEKVHWVQYTPYFNDGDACEFGVNEPCIIPFNFISDEDHPYEGPDLTSKTISKWEDTGGKWTSRQIPNPNYNEALVDPIETFNNIWRKMPNRVFLAAFDDHVEVTVSLNKKKEIVFKVEDFQHD